ncbi:Contact-dependent inhibitor A, partial [Escherichia coli]|nr:Contact-dependent inhibitor A [Escherichia coli]EFD8950055.1 Contact-dependent inhibitor A [Escherichia coli]EFO1368076.1 Contact-dependent inhibitor A [Escherichia coli]EHB0508895.1 Contact-dependent inhibitor A [Escherichia coli]EHC1529502.1 Contact-dependent inhibitor A [Escherichia coli]
VMVPKLYLSPEDITLHNGSVISGNNVQLAGGNITNSGGSINAQNDLLLDSTGSIDNLNAGLISAGGSLDLSAIGDIGNISSVISGKTVSLESATGNISNLTRTEQWAMNNGYNHFSGTDTGPLAAVRATDSLFMGAAGDISITGAAVSAGDSVLLSAGNDLNMNAIQAGERRRYGGSGWYETHAVAPTVTAGNSLMLSAGRDVNSQAAGITAENSMDIRAGRDVNMAAESTGAGDHDSTFSMKTVHDSVRQQGTDMTSGGDITVTAGRDITSVATAVTAKGDIRVNAGHDIVLGTATESDYHYSESGETRNRLLSHQTTRTITEDSVTREKGSLLSGNRVTVNAGNNLTVQGSDVVADRDVSLAADNHVDVLAATSTDTSWRFKETKKSGLTGTGGIGFTTGSSKTTHDRREAGTTQSQSASTIGSTAGNVSITAGKQAHISGSDVIANRDISITGDSVVVDPGHDRRTVDEKFEQKKSGLTVALSGTVGSAINNAATMAREAKETSDSRLAVLKGTQAVLSGVQAGVNHGLQQQSADPNNGIGVSISLNHQQSKSETKYQHDIVSGSTLSAGNNVSVTATGKNKDHNNSGDILITGSQIKSGNDTSLNAQNDILLAAAADTRQTTGKNSSKGGGVGVSFGGGTNGGGLSIFAGINGSEGREKGNGTTWTETTVDAGKNVSLTSGHDTTLSGAQVSGEKVTADVGNNLTISSLQDSDRYDSRQNSVAAGGSFTFGSMSGSGYASISQDKIKSNYDSVREQSGIYAGKDGFDVTVGNHTQLNGAVIASTATADKNRLDTGTLGFSDIENRADYKVEHQSVGISTGGSIGGQFAGNMANNLLVGANHEGHADSTTQSAVSAGNITIRDTKSQKQDVADLNRDAAHANQTLSPIFDREKEHQRLQQAQLIGEIGNQVADIARTEGQIAGEKAKRDPAALNQARAELEAAGKPFTEQDVAQRAYNNGMAASGFGTGGKYQLAIQAATAAVQGLAGGNLSAALAGGAAPYLAEVVKTMTTDPVTGEVNKAANVAAHAVVNAALAVAQGNNALAGAAGAATGEVVGIIATQMYGKPVNELSETEKQTVSTLATVAAGLAGGLVGDSGASAVAGAQSGKTTVENNMLNVIATETAANTAAAIAGATGNASKDTGNDNGWDIGGGCEGSREQCAVRDPSRDGSRGPGHVLNGDNTDENKQPNLGKDVASATDKEKAELGGAGAGTPGGWGPDNEEKARHQEVQQQRFDELSKIYDKSHPVGELTVDGQTIRQSSVSNRYGTTKVFESQTLTDKQIHNYAQQLAGDTPLKEVRPGIYTAKLNNGTSITLRNLSSSQEQTGARWTIDIRGNQQLAEIAHKYGRQVEIKFR